MHWILEYIRARSRHISRFKTPFPCSEPSHSPRPAAHAAQICPHKKFWMQKTSRPPVYTATTQNAATLNVPVHVGDTEATNRELEPGSDSSYPLETSFTISEDISEIAEVLFRQGEHRMFGEVDTLLSLIQNDFFFSEKTLQEVQS